MPLTLPFFWQPSGVVPSLDQLTLSARVAGKKDVTQEITGGKAGRHPLVVAELPGGKVIGDLRLAATSNDIVIGDLQTVFGCKDLLAHYALTRQRFRWPRKRKGTALLLGAANSDNYYHWMLDSLPRWKLLQAAGWKEYDFILLHSTPRAFQKETLDWLGVPPAKRLRCSKNFVYQFQRLVVPAMPFPSEEATAWACEWLRSLAPQNVSGPEKIFFTRRGISARQLANEAELEAALVQRGFVSIQPEKLSVKEQARLMGAAKCVVAPHGAALTNLIFAPSGALLLELFHPQHKNRCYVNLAAACGHRYAGMDGKAVPQTGNQLAYTVDVAAVMRLLETSHGVPGANSI